MLRSQFEEDLEKLHNQFYAMGQEVLSQINRTVRAFITHDRDLAKEVIEQDAEVNEYELKLEKKSFEIIARITGPTNSSNSSKGCFRLGTYG